MKPRISIVVPIYNETELVPDLLRHLSELRASETIIVDGGSTDDTWQRLHELKTDSMLCLHADTGRSVQMNTGALHAKRDLLLFLHADTRLPPDALVSIDDALHRHPERRWGRFDVRFDRAGPTLRVVAHAMNLRSAWTSICTGDQVIFVYRADFLRIGGFAPIPLMEDVDLSRRLKLLSRPLRIRRAVTTSSRRWTRYGAWRTIGSMWRLRWLYWWGVPASILAGRYDRKP